MNEYQEIALLKKQLVALGATNQDFIAAMKDTNKRWAISGDNPAKTDDYFMYLRSIVFKIGDLRQRIRRRNLFYSDNRIVREATSRKRMIISNWLSVNWPTSWAAYLEERDNIKKPRKELPDFDLPFGWTPINLRNGDTRSIIGLLLTPTAVLHEEKYGMVIECQYLTTEGKTKKARVAIAGSYAVTVSTIKAGKAIIDEKIAERFNDLLEAI